MEKLFSILFWLGAITVIVMIILKLAGYSPDLNQIIIIVLFTLIAKIGQVDVSLNNKIHQIDIKTANSFQKMRAEFQKMKHEVIGKIDELKREKKR